MTVHPIETRYNTPEMKRIFTEEYKLQKWLDVEKSLAHAQARLGIIKQEQADELERKGSIEIVKLERFKQIDKEIHHDTMAMVKAFAEQCDGDAGGVIHYGATSYDIVDTAWALILKDALEIIDMRIRVMMKLLSDLAVKWKHLVCVGRTHGQHAIPTTYGMKFANWLDEFGRHLDRLQEMKTRDVVGKFGGAVGTFASHGKNGLEIQELVMKRLGINANLISTQIVHRDRHAAIICFNAILMSTVSKIAKEIRNLQRNEIGEMFEEFAKKQVGSSTMAFKRNPHKSERLCGLQRVLLGDVVTMIEDNALDEHERVLVNSSVERITLPTNFNLLDFALVQLTSILGSIEINKENVLKNLNTTKGGIMSEYLMIEFVEMGYDRQKCHEFLRQAAMITRDKNISYKEGIMEQQKIESFYDDRITPDVLDDMLKPERYIGLADELVDRVVEKYGDAWK